MPGGDAAKSYHRLAPPQSQDFAAIKRGISPPPENEPDIQYAWRLARVSRSPQRSIAAGDDSAP
ncbi:MAG: hypothetical protein QMC74_12630, partial [Myxococcota bacterium]